MPVITCKTCGKTTNTACSNAWSKECEFGKFATECYASWNEQEQKWEKGCAYDKADPITKTSVDRLINNPPPKFEFNEEDFEEGD